MVAFRTGAPSEASFPRYTLHALSKGWTPAASQIELLVTAIVYLSGTAMCSRRGVFIVRDVCRNAMSLLQCTADSISVV